MREKIYPKDNFQRDLFLVFLSFTEKCFPGAADEHWSTRNITHFFKKSSTLLLEATQTFGNNSNQIFPVIKFSLLTPLAITQKNLQFYSSCFGWGFWSFSSSKLQLWQLLEDLKAGPGIFLCAWCFAAAAAATGIKSAAVIGQPGTVGTVRVFEAHHVTILHRALIISVLGVDLKGGVRIPQPGASCHGTGDSTNTTSPKLIL